MRGGRWKWFQHICSDVENKCESVGGKQTSKKGVGHAGRFKINLYIVLHLRTTLNETYV